MSLAASSGQSVSEFHSTLSPLVGRAKVSLAPLSHVHMCALPVHHLRLRSAILLLRLCMVNVLKVLVN